MLKQIRLPFFVASDSVLAFLFFVRVRFFFIGSLSKVTFFLRCRVRRLLRLGGLATARVLRMVRVGGLAWFGILMAVTDWRVVYIVSVGCCLGWDVSIGRGYI